VEKAVGFWGQTPNSSTSEFGAHPRIPPGVCPQNPTVFSNDSRAHSSLGCFTLIVVGRVAAAGAKDSYLRSTVLFTPGFRLVVSHGTVGPKADDRNPIQRDVLADQVPQHAVGAFLAQIEVKTLGAF